jgi:transcriptional regulator with XRE-family HTH domain
MSGQDSNILRVVISQIDYLLICQIRELRLAKGLSQIELSRKLDLADGFVSKVEAFSERAKYSIRHLKLLADALECSIAHLFPDENPKFDYITLELRRINKVNKDGTISKKPIQIVERITPVEKTQYPLEKN